MSQSILVFAGLLSAAASVAHIGVVLGGPSWYRFFGAGERMATLAEKKSFVPVIVTLGIAFVLGIWALYAFSAADIGVRMPLIKPVLAVITGIYLLRGVGGLIAPLVSNHPAILENSKLFWFWSSAICLFIGAVHLLGLAYVWTSL